LCAGVFGLGGAVVCVFLSPGWLQYLFLFIVKNYFFIEVAGSQTLLGNAEKIKTKCKKLQKQKRTMKPYYLLVHAECELKASAATNCSRWRFIREWELLAWHWRR
jgi:hypothetical protein